MKIRIQVRKVRNPMVAPSLTRKAGAHRKSGKALRQQAEQALRQRTRSPASDD